MRKLLISFVMIQMAGYTFSQDVIDLVRYSNLQLQGSARFESMGGSFGALGSDISSSLINPAGYGRYSSSQFGIGFNFNNIRNTSDFQNQSTLSKKNVFKPANIGFVIANDVSHKNQGFLYNQIGFSYNRVDNFSNRVEYSGKMLNSLLDVFAGSAYLYPTNDLPPFTSQLAYTTNAIYDRVDGSYSPRLDIGDTMNHNRVINTKGGVSEYTFSYSTNYLNRLYFGINWGIRTARYTEDYTHKESQYGGPITSIDSFEYIYQLETRGSGNNFKIGIIYLPIQQLRLGLSLHTPTYYSLKDNWSADMSTVKNDTLYGIATGKTPTGDYKYRLRTPAKIVGSLAYVFGTRGSINVDIEYINYASANLKSTNDPVYEPEPNDYRFQNEEAAQILKPVMNIRVGGEMVFQSQYFVRGGFAYYPQPYESNVSDGTKAGTTISFGGGIKLGNNSIDLAYKIQSKNFNYYAFNGSRTAISTYTNGLILSYSVNF
jgi:hypothetical protein